MKLKNIMQMSILLAASGAFMVSCNNQWDDHTSVTGSVAGSVYAAIEAEQDLSAFKGLLQATGYDKVLSGSNNYTVLAPTNAALAELSTWDTLAIVRNHIAPLSYKAIQDTDRLLMLNGKGLAVAEAEIQETEVVCSNGVLRLADKVVLPLKNLYEQVAANKDLYDMAAIIYAAGDSVMDPDKSVQKGVDPATGQAIYDTVWMYQNPFLDSLHIDNEDANFTLVMLENENFHAIQKKYAKYMYQLEDAASSVKGDSTFTYAAAANSLIYDLVCMSANAGDQELIAAFTGVKLDMSQATVTENVASNGNVLFADGVNIRIKNNKIKDIIVEGEDYVGARSANHTYVRMRDYASGGKDMMMIGYSEIAKDFKTFTVLDADGNPVKKWNSETDSTYTYPASTKYFWYESATITGKQPGQSNNELNAYVAYRPHMYSCKYRVYWVAVDDIPSHYAGDTLDLDWDPAQPNKPCTSVNRLVQKLYIGQEGKRLVWGVNTKGVAGNGFISNYKNNGAARCMVGYDPVEANDENHPNFKKPAQGMNAGDPIANKEIFAAEQPLFWCAAGGDYDQVVGKSPLNPYDPAVPNRPAREFLTIANECDIDIFVTNSANTADSKVKANGMIFLDYIRFEPVIEDEE